MQAPTVASMSNRTDLHVAETALPEGPVEAQGMFSCVPSDCPWQAPPPPERKPAVAGVAELGPPLGGQARVATSFESNVMTTLPSEQGFVTLHGAPPFCSVTVQRDGAPPKSGSVKLVPLEVPVLPPPRIVFVQDFVSPVGSLEVAIVGGVVTPTVLLTGGGAAGVGLALEQSAFNSSWLQSG